MNIDRLKENKEYELLEELDFGDVIPFISRNIRSRGLFSWAYFIINILTLLALIAVSLMAIVQEDLSWGNLFKYLLLGVLAGTIAIIPFHEFFHFIAYLTMGARRIKFGADLSQLIFYVVADHFPVTRPRLVYLAMAPFFSINLIIILLLVTAFPEGTILGGFLLLSHNIMCIGDFAMVNYALRKEHKNLVTFDDAKKRKSYFYIRKSNTE
jgi:hypothetical protein